MIAEAIEETTRPVNTENLTRSEKRVIATFTIFFSRLALRKSVQSTGNQSHIAICCQEKNYAFCELFKKLVAEF